MASEQSQRPQTLRYQSNTTFLIAPNASSVPGGSAQPGLLQRSSQSALTTTNGGAWQSQAAPRLGTEQPAIAAVEASELLQVGSDTVVAPPPQPARYAPATLRRSHMTTSLTEVSGVGGPGRIAAGGPFGPTGSSLSVPPVPSTSTVSPAPAVPGWARRVPPGTPLRRANMPASVNDAHGFGSSAGSTGSMTTPSRQPYFATSMTEAPGSVAISSVRVIGCPSPRDSLSSMPQGLRPLRLPMRRSPSRRQQQSRPGPPGHRFPPPPPNEEIGRRPPPGVDFREQERIDEGYESAEIVGGRQDRQPPLSHLPASNVDFRDREGTDDGYDSTETMSRQPPNRRRGPTRSRSARRQMNGPSRSPPVVGSKSASGPRLSRIRMFHIEREFGTPAAEAETRNQPDDTQDHTAAPPPVPSSQPPSLSDIPDESTIDDYGPSRPRVCNCPGTVTIRRGPPCRSTSGRLRGAYIKNDDNDDDDDMDDLYMIKKSKKKSKRRQPPEPSPPPVAPTPSGGLMGFLSGLVGGRQPPPPPPPARNAGAYSDSDDESEYELRRFDRRQLENFVRKIDLKQTDDESKEGRKAKRKGEKKEEKDDKKPEEKKPEEKAPEPEKKEEKPPEVKTEPAAAPMDGPLDVKVPVVFVFGGPGSGKGTQCDKIVQKYGFTHISSGDLLRAEVESGSDRGKEINEIMKKGELAPLAMILQLIKEAIKKNLEKAKGFLIDGYPRNVEQGERFEAEVCKCTNLVYFEVKDETMKARLLKRGQTSGRVDDNEETIAKRLKTFHDESEPVLDKYKAIVHKISAEDEPDKVFEAVTALFDEITKPK